MYVCFIFFLVTKHFVIKFVRFVLRSVVYKNPIIAMVHLLIEDKHNECSHAFQIHLPNRYLTVQ